MTPSHPTASSRFRRFIDRELDPTVVTATTVVILVIVAGGDFITGPYLIFSTFYLVGVVFAAWYGGLRRGVVIAVLAAASGVATTVVQPGAISNLAIALNGLSRLTTYVFMAFIVASERQGLRRIEDLSNTDPLTGLANRREFYRRGVIELDRAIRQSEPLSLVYLDLDDLKVCNDRFGHHAGDEMLLTFSSLARSSFRSSDILARLGGDEFAILLSNVDAESTDALLDRFVASLASNPDGPIRVSIGAICGSPTGDCTIDTMLGDADALMYEAKQAGKAGRRVRGSLTAL